MSPESTLLAGWDNYYVILGSSAGGLTGLTFVVIALIRDSPMVLYGGLLLAAWLVWVWPQPTLYGVALIALILLFIGIRNAWDIAVWMMTHPGRSGGGGRDPE